MFEKNSEKYDPVTCSVPGVDPQQRREELREILMAGDPLPSNASITIKKPSFLEKIGIKIIN